IEFHPTEVVPVINEGKNQPEPIRFGRLDQRVEPFQAIRSAIDCDRAIIQVLKGGLARSTVIDVQKGPTTDGVGAHREDGVHDGLPACVGAVSEEVAIHADDGEWPICQYEAVRLDADETTFKRHGNILTEKVSGGGNFLRAADITSIEWRATRL